MQLIQKITVFDPGFVSGRATQYAWWPKASLHELAYCQQEHLLRRPGTYGLCQVSEIAPEHYESPVHSKGVIETLMTLAEVGEDREAFDRVLKLAVLHPLLHSSRGVKFIRYRTPNCYSSVREYDKQLRAEHKGGLPWFHGHTDVIPAEIHGYRYPWPVRYKSEALDPCFSAEDLLLRLEHRIETLKVEWQVVEIEYTRTQAEADAVLAKFNTSPMAMVRAEERRLEAERDAQRKASWERAQQEAAQERQARKERHPRYGEWDGLSAEEKKELIWSKPMTKLAAEFGLSNVAIRKQCRKAGIALPPTGYWLRGVQPALSSTT